MSDRDDDDDRPRRRPRDDRAEDREDDDRPRSRRRDDDEEDDDRPRRGRPAGGESNGAATAALVLGILSMFCSIFTAIPAVIFGFVGLSRSGRTGSGKGMAIAGMVVGVLSVMGHGLLAALLIPAVAKVQEAAGRAKSSNNLKQIALGFHGYHDANSHLPMAGGNSERFGAVGGPTDPTLSWRVSLLPYVEQQAVYKSFTMDQPWDGPTNRPLADLKIGTYADPGDPFDPATRYRGFLGPGAMFEPARDGKPVRLTLAAVTDGLSNTILAAEAADKVPWPQTKELPFDPAGPLPPLGTPGQKTFLVVFADGSVRSIRSDISPKALKAAVTRAGGEIEPLD